MSFSISTIPAYEKNFKRLLKKYTSLKKDFAILVDILINNLTHGIALRKNCFKIRLQIGSKGKGESGGARGITLVKFEKNGLFC